MHFWIIALPKLVLEHCMELGKFGRNQRHTARVEKGDKLALYESKSKTIVALGTVTRGYYFDETLIFTGEAIYPHRFDFEAELLPKPADFIGIIDKMSFITNLMFWQIYFRLGFKEISVKDWETISKHCKK